MNLLSGKSDGVRRWRTADGQEIGKSGLQYNHFCVEGWQVDVCVGLVGRQGMGREVEGTDLMGAVWNQVRCSSGHLRVT